MNRVWTEEELEILRRDRAAKVPVPVTAAKLGRPVPATYARARLIGTLVQPHQSWDEASTARLRELVSADPPMTDKRIAEELGRTITQIRWKMQDLGLTGVRDLSKLAKITASETIRPKAATPLPQRPVPQKSLPQKCLLQTAAPSARPSVPVQATSRVQPKPAPMPLAPAPLDPRAALERALKRLESKLAERLKASISESEAGMVRAATEAIAEKRRIDERIAALSRKTATTPAAPAVEVQQAEPRKLEAIAPIKRKPSEAVSKARAEKAPVEKTKRAAPQPEPRKKVTAGIQGASQTAPVRPVAPPATPKIVVLETPVAARPEPAPDSAPAPVSGRGGWKSVRRDPARIMAQAKAKAANRADAVDLAQAAQAAIERFIAERGVTKTETNGIQSIVSRLQARGYIVVRDGDGWVIDQRHRVDGEKALIAFAEARGISLDIAA